MHLLVQIAAASQFEVALATTARTVATQAVADDVALTSRWVPSGTYRDYTPQGAVFSTSPG